jgi:hypothetical protein
MYSPPAGPLMHGRPPDRLRLLLITVSESFACSTASCIIYQYLVDPPHNVNLARVVSRATLTQALTSPRRRLAGDSSGCLAVSSYATTMSIIWCEPLLRGVYALHGPSTVINVSNASSCQCLHQPAFPFHSVPPNKKWHVPLTHFSHRYPSLPRSGHPTEPTSCASCSRCRDSHL